MSIIEFLLLMVCGFGLLVILTLGTWVLINKSKLEEPDSRQQKKLEVLDREYAAGDLDEAEYDRRRERILDDRMR